MTRNFTVVAVSCALLTLAATGSAGSESPNLEFVKLYVEQLGAVERIRDNAEKELAADTPAQRIADCVRTMTRYQLELTVQISAMRGIHLNKPFDSLPVGIADLDQQKLQFYRQYGDACTTMMEGPKPNVDYGKIAASLPKINAQVEFIDEGIFKISPTVFATLIQMKENSRGGADHLIITGSQRVELTHRIDEIFGEKLNQQNQNYLVSAASVLKFYLEKKGYKSSDEAWD